ncbi:HLA-F: HLA class I histocompatibility antigen alpha chain F [Crotalus adamanteus]|uniref:HLA-F: HLA class I histocompatibility antigen alpha chain F n=1 Tax=Crotalus adamanteus TaxID=8729 RepID=A0AAW1BVN1_CROAD
MPPCPACLLVLGAALGVSVPGDCCGSPSHFLRYFYLHLSEPSRFFIWGKLDDQPIIHFDSLTGRVETLVCWMEEVKEGTFLSVEWVFRSDLENLSNLNNLSEGKVTYKLINDSQEILVCEAYGFYPKEIQVNWTRDGENWEQGIIRRNVTPNSDGTYYVWIGIKINPEERNQDDIQPESLLQSEVTLEVSLTVADVYVRCKTPGLGDTKSQDY